MSDVNSIFNQSLVRVSPNGSFTLVAGGGGDATGEGVAALTADLQTGPIAALPDGSVILAERARDRLRRIAGGLITTIAGANGMGSFLGDGVPASGARMNTPEGVEAWRGSHILFVDGSNERVRAIW